MTALPGFASGHMALQIAGVVKHADDLDDAPAAAVHEKVPGLADDAYCVRCPIAAEEEVIRPEASRQFRALLRTWPFRVSNVNRLLQESPAAYGSSFAETFFAPDKHLVDIRRAEAVKTMARRSPESGPFAFVRDLPRYFKRRFIPNLIDMAIQFIQRSEFHDFAAINLIKAFFHGAAQPFQAGLIFALAAFHQGQAFTHDFARIAIMAGTHFGLDEAVECSVRLMFRVGMTVV